MKLLAIETVTEVCSVAVCDGEKISQEISTHRKGHSQFVLGMIEKLLKEANLSLNDLDGIVVDSGPGSFTGIRIGLGIAQGLAYGAGIPVIPVTSLETLAGAVNNGVVLPAIDARMKQIYCGLYKTQEGKQPVALESPMVIAPGEIRHLLSRAEFGIGSGWDEYGEALLDLDSNSSTQISYGCFPKAVNAIKIARIMGLDFAVDPRGLEATYIRNSVVIKSLSKD